MCMPLGSRYSRSSYTRRYRHYVEIGEIKMVSLASAREHFSDEEVLAKAKTIIAQKSSWSYDEIPDRYVLEKLYWEDKYLARIAATDKNRNAIKEMISCSLFD